MALDNNLKIVASKAVNTGVGTSDNSTAFDFGTSLAGSGDKTPFPDRASFTVVCEDAPEAGALPIRCDLEISFDGGSNWRKICAVTFTNAKKEVKSVVFGLLDYVPEAAVIAGTDRAAATNLQARVVSNYTTSAGTFTYSAFLGDVQHASPVYE